MNRQTQFLKDLVNQYLGSHRKFVKPSDEFDIDFIKFTVKKLGQQQLQKDAQQLFLRHNLILCFFSMFFLFIQSAGQENGYKDAKKG